MSFLKRCRLGFFGGLLVLSAMLLSGTSSMAQSANGYTLTNVNQRAGPGTEYPVIVTVPKGAQVSILGCLADYRWCEITYRGGRGWMSAIYLMGYHRDGYYALRDYAPQMGYQTVRFDLPNYWDSNYRSRPFYAERERWSRPRERGYVETNSFYGPLARYGDWLWFKGQYVWVPDRIDASWRPYTRGRWVFTERHGWMWVSNEPFGWAVYHYGRWGYSNRIGWFWVPGRRWGPAWVSWREANNYLAWAPLPPSYDERASLNIEARAIPDYYWQVVPSRSFLSDDISRDVIRDRKRYRPVIEESRPLGNVTVVNNVVVNNVVNVTYVEQKTETTVIVHEVEAKQGKPEDAKVEGNTVEIFQPAADAAPAEEAPPEVKTVEQVAEDSATKDQAEEEPTTDDLLLPEEVKPATEEPPAASIEDAKPEAPPPAVEEAAPAEEALPTEAPAAEETPAEAPAAEQAPPAAEEAPAAKTPTAEETPAPPAEGASPPPAEEPPPSAEKAAPPAEAAPPPAEEASPPAEQAPAPEEAAPAEPPAPPPAMEPEPQPKKRKRAAPPAAPEEVMREATPPPMEAAPPPMEAAPPPPSDEAPPPDQGRTKKRKAAPEEAPPPETQDVLPQMEAPPPPADLPPPEVMQDAPPTE